MTSNRYQHTSHLVYSCKYHVVFCPKYRRKVLIDGIDERLGEIFEEVADKWEFNIIEKGIMPDHVHLLIDVNPRFGIMNAVKKLKGTSATMLRNEFPALKHRLPCLWTRGSLIARIPCRQGTTCRPSQNKPIPIRRQIQNGISRRRRPMRRRRQLPKRHPMCRMLLLR